MLRARWAALAAGACALLPSLAEAAAHAAAGPPTHRAALALLALLGGFALCLSGWESVDRRRRLRGVALIAAGLVFGVGAMSLLRLNALPQTWDWWI